METDRDRYYLLGIQQRAAKKMEEKYGSKLTKQEKADLHNIQVDCRKGQEAILDANEQANNQLGGQESGHDNENSSAR